MNWNLRNEDTLRVLKKEKLEPGLSTKTKKKKQKRLLIWAKTKSLGFCKTSVLLKAWTKTKVFDETKNLGQNLCFGERETEKE